jgi:hypothetical protein
MRLAGLGAAPSRPGCAPARWGTWVYANKKALRVGAVALASLALVFWSRPTGKVVILLAVLLLVALALIEFLGRPPERVQPTREPLVQ